jgi:mannonate dehydratase
MKRREILEMAVAGGVAGIVAASETKAQEITERAARGMNPPKIKDISVIETQPAGVRLSCVKITTDQAGLYGYGCATFTQRADLVSPAVQKYLKPLLVGRPVDRIEDTWQMCYASSYWRNGPVLNNAISGVDQALWDIKGRMAGMPVYQLLGGKCREAAASYTHISGNEIPQIIDDARKAMSQGFRHLRLQIGIPGMSGYGAGGGTAKVQALHSDPVYEPADVEPLKLFFLEDPFSPEDIAYHRQIREQCSTPIAMGELFNSPHEWTPLIEQRLIDYIRIHISQAGGLTPCRKVAIFCELYGVKTAWHGPGDVCPVGHMCNLHLDLASHNFGIQEGGVIRGVETEIFKGSQTVKDGYLYANESPGWGIEVDEKLAAKYPFKNDGPRGVLNGGWGVIRRLDGTVIKQ